MFAIFTDPYSTVIMDIPRGSQLAGVYGGLFAFATCVVALRLYANLHRSGSLGADDYVIVVAWVSAFWRFLELGGSEWWLERLLWS